MTTDFQANRKRSLSRISELMTSFVKFIENENASGRLDINLLAEDILIPIFSEVYGYENLENLNVEGGTYPSIDLGDKVEGVAIQVTSDSSSKKVIKTLKNFKSYLHPDDSNKKSEKVKEISKEFKQYKRIIVYVITQKQDSYTSRRLSDLIENLKDDLEFKVDEDIRDHKDLLKDINNLNDLDKIQRIEVLLEKEFGRNSRPWRIFRRIIVWLVIALGVLGLTFVVWNILHPLNPRCPLEIGQQVHIIEGKNVFSEPSQSSLGSPWTTTSLTSEYVLSGPKWGLIEHQRNAYDWWWEVTDAVNGDSRGWVWQCFLAECRNPETFASCPAP